MKGMARNQASGLIWVQASDYQLTLLWSTAVGMCGYTEPICVVAVRC